MGVFNCLMPLRGTFYRNFTSMMFGYVIKTFTVQKLIKINQIGMTIHVYGQYANISNFMGFFFFFGHFKGMSI